MTQVNLWIAFLGGIASFVSPCCLPLYPSYLSYITGISVRQLKEGGSDRAKVRLLTLAHSVSFLLGFSLVFFALSWGANLFADFFMGYRDVIRQLSALVILLMGLFMLGIFRPGQLMKEYKLQIRWRPAGFIGSFVIGLGFSAGWSPCIGSILSAIIALSATEPGSWLLMTSAYALGFSLPFLLLSFFISATKWILPYTGIIMKVSGGIMILLAVLLFTDQMTAITNWFNSRTPDWLRF